MFFRDCYFETGGLLENISECLCNSGRMLFLVKEKVWNEITDLFWGRSGDIVFCPSIPASIALYIICRS